VFRNPDKTWCATLLFSLVCSVADADSIRSLDTNSIGEFRVGLAPSSTSEKVQAWQHATNPRSLCYPFMSSFIDPKQLVPLVRTFALPEVPPRHTGDTLDQVIDLVVYVYKHWWRGKQRPRRKCLEQNPRSTCEAEE